MASGVTTAIHPILFLTVTAVIAGADGPADIEQFGEDNEDWLRGFVDLPAGFAQSVRRHWSVESMHWILDVVFHEDGSRIRTGHATENMSSVRRFVTILLKQDMTKVSFEQQRKKPAGTPMFSKNSCLDAEF